jgi:MFS family permease
MTTNSPSSIGSVKAWIVVLCASLFFFYEFVQMNMFNTINANLMQTFNINATQVSNLSAFYFYMDVLFLFPAGIILDHFSVRKVIVAALSICIIATFALSFTETYHMAAAMRALSGMGAAFCFLSAMRLATRWFPTTHLALVMGFVVTMAMLGGMFAQTPIAILKEYWGWRATVRLDALLGVLFMGIIIWQVRDFPPHTHMEQQTENLLHKIGFWPSVFTAWKNSQNWLAGFYTSFLNLPILIIGALWGSQFLIQVHNFTQTQASNVMMCLFLGTIIGCPVLGAISDAVKLRKLPMIVCALLSLVVVLLIMYLPGQTYTSLIVLFFSLGFITSAQIISYPIIAESNPGPLAGTATGWSAVLIMGGGAVGQPLFGWLLDKHWDGTKINNVPFYSISDYHFAWMIFPIMFFVALIIAFIVKETRCKPYHDPRT